MGAEGVALRTEHHQALNPTSRSQVTSGLTKTQVWSLTQFYSVDFSQSRIGVNSAFSTNAQSRFAPAVLECVLRPLGLALSHLTVPLSLSVVPEAMHQAKALVSSKKPFKHLRRR